MNYLGRFAPTPSGPLHAGSIATALACDLDARVQQGAWILRFDDLDTPRNQAGAVQSICNTLQALGLHWQGEVVFQSQRTHLYQQAFEQLKAQCYACTCSRQDIAHAMLFSKQGQSIYPGTCRNKIQKKLEIDTKNDSVNVSGELSSPTHPLPKTARAWRFAVDTVVDEKSDPIMRFYDRWWGDYQQNLITEVGDFVLRRADGVFSYHLANVVDDAALPITHIVRGADLLDSTPRHIALQHALHYSTPAYLHVPVALDAQGNKLSKQNEAPAISSEQPLRVLQHAAQHLGLQLASSRDLADFYAQATQAWAHKIANNFSH